MSDQDQENEQLHTELNAEKSAHLATLQRASDLLLKPDLTVDERIVGTRTLYAEIDRILGIESNGES